MKSKQIVFVLFLPFFLLFTVQAWAQSSGGDDSPAKYNPNRKFHVGFYVGSFFTNKYTASLYDGYGYDINGVKEDFGNSFMYRRINNDYGGGNGQPDLIAQALGVNHADWTFQDPKDMPFNLKYNVAIMAGIQTRYCVDKKNAIILNANATKLTVNGDFTIEVTTPTIGIAPPTAIRPFSLIGGERRAMLQLGYQRILGNDEKFNVFLEGGLEVNMAKYDKNVININGLQIDLAAYYSLPEYATFRAKNLTGVGLGAFAGIGLNLSMSRKWTVQLVYNPSYDRINLGVDPKPVMQNSLGLRAYYNL
jgi:hypothetical protein